jgi:hypothetical protein
MGFTQTRYDIKRHRVNLFPIDTLESFVYQTKEALIYFSQQDIEDFILNKAKKDGTAPMYPLLLDTLRQNTDCILIREDTIYDDPYQARDSHTLPVGGQIPVYSDKRDYLSQLFMFLAADLMIEGKCLPYDRAEKKFYTSSIIIKRDKGPMGSKYLTFLLPNKTRFYSIVTAFGE